MPNPFYFLRHGQTDWNKAGMLQGSTDIALNDYGRDQAKQAAQTFKDHGIKSIIASPLSRANETALIVGRELGLEPVIDKRLIERNFGAFEGLVRQQVDMLRNDPITKEKFYLDMDGKLYPNDCEPLKALSERIYQVIEDYRARFDGVLFVSHGVPFRMMTRLYTGTMYSTPNAAPVRLERETHERFSLINLDPSNQSVLADKSPIPTTMGQF